MNTRIISFEEAEALKKNRLYAERKRIFSEGDDCQIFEVVLFENITEEQARDKRYQPVETDHFFYKKPI